jgi:hypothetical protein
VQNACSEASCQAGHRRASTAPDTGRGSSVTRPASRRFERAIGNQ